MKAISDGQNHSDSVAAAEQQGAGVTPAKYITLAFRQPAPVTSHLWRLTSQMSNVTQKIILDSVSKSDISLLIFIFSGFDCDDRGTAVLCIH